MPLLVQFYQGCQYMTSDEPLHQGGGQVNGTTESQLQVYMVSEESHIHGPGQSLQSKSKPHMHNNKSAQNEHSS